MTESIASPPPSAALSGEGVGTPERVLLGVFIGLPFAALVAAIPLAWGRGIGWHDVVLAVVFYLITGHGITIGYHRLFTHRAFKAKRPLKIVLAISGMLAVQGDVIGWVADHRRHHQFSDSDGDPHSPWRFGTSPGAVAKGLVFAHIGWPFTLRKTNRDRYVRDLLDDPDLVRLSAQAGLWTLASFGLPALLGGLWAGSWHGALTALFWAGLVRVSLVHHVTWSINSICHAAGERPYRSRDKSGNVWWLAVLSGGEAWHNYHHADPTSARHGIGRGQLDSSARMIWLFEKLGWASDVRWPTAARAASRRVVPT